jgi:hypothetical protein
MAQTIQMHITGNPQVLKESTSRASFAGVALACKCSELHNAWILSRAVDAFSNMNEF